MLNFLIVFVLLLVLFLSLMSGPLLSRVYVTCGNLCGIDPLWVNRHGWKISNYGHLLSSALLTYLLLSHHYKYRWSLLLLVLTGLAGIELLQNFIPTRQASLTDFSYDVIGMGLGLALVRVLRRKTG